MYAGVDGYPTRQSDPDRAKFGPRAGVSWALGERTVVRGGYGLFWGPHQFQFPSENTLGTRGFSATTTYFASADNGLTPCAGCALRDPFPNGITRPQGSAQGLITGAGGDIHFNDQSRRSPYLHKFSVDVQHELPLAITLRAGYLASRAERLDVGGTSQAAININQIDPAYQSLGSALQEIVPNPFSGNASFGAFSTQPISRGQLLRPYPQFGNVFAHQVSAGRSRYHSFTLDGQRRLRGGWGAGVNYTWSRLDDNLIGELNFFSDRGGGNQLVLDNYDLDAEFGRSLADTPHRLNVTTTIELPFGDGRRWLNEAGVLRALAGGWSATVVGFLQSGFPIRIVQANTNSNLLGSSQRPNVVPGVDPMAPNAGEYDPSCRCVAWLNPAAWSGAAPFTFGDAPRVDPRLRTPGAEQLEPRGAEGGANRHDDADAAAGSDQPLRQSRSHGPGDRLRPPDLRPDHQFGQRRADGAVDGSIWILIRADARIGAARVVSAAGGDDVHHPDVAEIVAPDEVDKSAIGGRAVETHLAWPAG